MPIFLPTGGRDALRVCLERLLLITSTKMPFSSDIVFDRLSVISTANSITAVLRTLHVRRRWDPGTSASPKYLSHSVNFYFIDESEPSLVIERFKQKRRTVWLSKYTTFPLIFISRLPFSKCGYCVLSTKPQLFPRYTSTKHIDTYNHLYKSLDG